MNEKDVLFAALGAAAVVITLLVGFATSWSLYTLLVGVLLAGAALGSRFYLQLRADREASPPLRDVRESPDDPGRPATRVAVGPVALATATPEFRLTFSATVLWRPCRAEQPDAAPTRQPTPDTVQARAEPMSASRPAEEPGSAELAQAPRPADEPSAGEPVPAEPAPAPPSSMTEAPGPKLPAAGQSPEHTLAAQIHAEQIQVEQNGDAGRRWHSDRGALATAAAVARATEIVLGSSAADAGATKQKLAEDLGWSRTDSTGTVLWCVQDVDLQPADPDDPDQLRTLSKLRKQAQVWEQEREHERNIRQYLGDDVLTTTGSALVWWLARHLDDVQGAIGMIGDLSTLSAASQDQDDPGRLGSDLAAPQPTAVGPAGDRAGEDLAATRDLLERLFPRSDDERTMFARDLAMIAERSGRNDYARQVRAMFGVPDLDADPRESPVGDPQGG